MITIVAPTDTSEASKDSVREAVDRLRAGEIVALPTETVYGLGADACNDSAVAKVFEAKERPSFDPLIVHLPSKRHIDLAAEVPEEMAPLVRKLTEQFWPGPLTLILPKKPEISSLVTAGLDTVGVRVCDHPVFAKIIKEFGGPIAAPSANRFGSISPTSASAVQRELEGRIPLIVDGGACARGLESTIVRIEMAEPKPILHVLRAGPITKEDLKNFGKVRYEKNQTVEDNAPEAPGMLARHYAPATPFRLLDSPDTFTPQPDKRYALLSYRGQEKDGYIDLADWEEVAVLSPGSGKMPEAAIRLFYLLRQLDDSGVDEIVCEPIPERGLGVAIMDRLRRAAER